MEPFFACQALELARASGASAADALSAQSTDIQCAQRLGKPETLERSEHQALSLRAWVGARHALASTTDLSPKALKELAERVVAMAKAAPEDAFCTLAPEEKLAQTMPELDLAEPDEPGVEWLRAQCAVAEDAARGTPGITNSEGAEAGFHQGTVTLATSAGWVHSYRTTSTALSVSVLAGEDTQMERDSESSYARFRADLKSAEEIGKEAARRALERLNPRKVSTCTAPVMFDPRVGRSLVYQFAGATSGAAIARGTSFLKNDLGKKIFSEAISIVDDPHRVRGLASKPFDGEGVGNAKRTMVERGMLASWFLDVRSANQLGLSTTGHASRSTGSNPSPSPTNLYMQPGNMSPTELMYDIGSGFYVTEMYGMGVNLVTGDFSQGASGFWIERGEIAYPVSEVTIAGNLRAMFLTMTPANDLEFRYGVNAPTLRVEGMTVAGA